MVLKSIMHPHFLHRRSSFSKCSHVRQMLILRDFSSLVTKAFCLGGGVVVIGLFILNSVKPPPKCLRTGRTLTPPPKPQIVFERGAVLNSRIIDPPRCRTALSAPSQMVSPEVRMEDEHPTHQAMLKIVHGAIGPSTDSFIQSHSSSYSSRSGPSTSTYSSSSMMGSL